ncbi:ornithine carbamoyltransferase [Streptomyces sp. MUM 203J]|uniref:ornithine carbamoyltransferase n=1 Tax=Streptomyces sp. MUM 203J TaxID=2791990 RepID=UPI001F04D0C7|nr:ornithine carbamoyltransferase [Streptomyces sp. MUM 203J]MCH0538730.1 ornithine carbamoyltransferase [Streptomyces sp. MUM 203J]
MTHPTSVQAEAPPRAPRSLISLHDLAPEDLQTLVRRSCEWYEDRRPRERPLRDRVVGTLFTHTSTRTRTAFTSGAVRLGATVIAFGPNDLQLATGERLSDTGRILGGMLDALVVRSSVGEDDLRELSRAASIPVVNAMVREEHPTQGISDIAMLSHRFGSLRGLHLAYLGEGNNTAAALALGLALVSGVTLTIATPPGYGLDPTVLTHAQKTGEASGSEIIEVHRVDDIDGGVDVVYTTQWQTTGTTKSDPDWRTAFLPFTVDEHLMARWPDALFMHDLPARRGEEVTSSVLDGPRSIAWDQAQMKLASAMAVLDWCLA